MKKSVSLLMILMLLLTGCTSSNQEEKVERKSQYSIGETVEVEGILITLNGVRVLEGDEFMKPEDGEEWIALDFTFENTTDKAEYIAGIFEISLRDSEGRDKDINIWGDVQGSLDGDLLSNDKLRGEKAFTVKSEDEELTALYKSTFSGNEPIKFVLF